MNNFLQTIFVSVLVATLFSCSEKKDQNYDETLDTFLEVTGKSLINNPLMDQMYEMPMFGSAFMQNDSLKAEMEDLYEEMELKVKALYKEQLTQSELQQLIDFYKSPIGRKILETDQKVAIESMKYSQEYAMKKVNKSIRSNKNFNYKRDK